MSTYEEMYQGKRMKIMEANLRGLDNEEGWYNEEEEFEVLSGKYEFAEMMILMLLFFPHFIMFFYGMCLVAQKFKVMYANKVD